MNTILCIEILNIKNHELINSIMFVNCLYRRSPSGWPLSAHKETFHDNNLTAILAFCLSLLLIVGVIVELVSN